MPSNSGNVAVCLCASAQMCACEVTACLRPSLVLEWMINSLTAGWPTVKCAEPALTAGSSLTSCQAAFASVDRPPRPLSQHLINDSISLGSMIWPFDMFVYWDYINHFIILVLMCRPRAAQHTCHPCLARWAAWLFIVSKTCIRLLCASVLTGGDCLLMYCKWAVLHIVCDFTDQNWRFQI